MVVKIAAPSSDLFQPIRYNEKKVAEGGAVLVAAVNMDHDGETAVADTFSRFERMNIRSRMTAFHMTINPGEGERWDDAKLVEYVKRLLEGLGYSGQPFVIYRHEDIGRMHYHVVSTRIGRDGRKIRDLQEGARCMRLARSLGEEFGYALGEQALGRKNSGRLRVNRFGVEQYDPKGEEAAEQMRHLFGNALAYRFSSWSQFVQILRVMSLKARERVGLDTHLLLQGLDRGGRPCTPLLSERDLGTALFRMFRQRARECGRDDSWKQGTAKRVSAWCSRALYSSATQREFRRTLRDGKIDYVLDYDAAKRKYVGGVFVDHQTKCAFDISGFGRDFSLKMLNEVFCTASAREDVPSLGDFLSGLSSGSSRSREKDQRESPFVKKKKRKLKF